MEITEYLKENVREEGIFKFVGRAHIRRKILTSLLRGDRSTLRHYLEGAAIEGAAALQMFIKRLPEPLIPIRVQKLMLAENPGIPEMMVASDALGLLRQDLSGRHLELLACLLDLLYVVTKSHPTTELKGCNLPVALLPLFFDLKPSNVMRWRHVAATFNELINRAPLWLDACGKRERKEQPNYNNATMQETENITQRQDTQGEETSVTLLLQQQNRRFLRGEPSDQRSLTSISMIPLVFMAQSQLHPVLRIFA